ncbi:MAG TPA: glycosyltransferase, partial [Candidatus Eisenbacteria bacterium]|nr:glycosyltransferase [Candidatus Eisenbacteria bacterium]
ALALAGLHRSLRPNVVHWHAARAHALGAIASLLAPGPARVLSRRVDFLVRRSIGSRLLYAIPIDAIVAISNGVAAALAKSGVDPARVIVVPSGIDLAPFDAPFDRAAIRSRLGLNGTDVLALQVAALAPHKSQTTLLHAVALVRSRHPNLRVWVAGEGPLRASLEREHSSLELGEIVRFLGFRDDVADLLRAADFFVISSYLEGLGTSILDAMAAGLPVVGTRVGGIPEAVREGVSGILVPPNDPRALGEAMGTLAGDPNLRARYGEAGRGLAAGFSADFTESRTREVYQAVLGRRKPRPDAPGRP